LSNGDLILGNERIKVVNINDHDLINRQFNGFDLFSPMQELSVDISMIV